MVVGVKNTPLVSDMRPIDNVDYDAPFELITNTWYKEHASYLGEEGIKISSHSHPLFKEENVAIYCRLEEGAMSIINSSRAKPFQCKRDDTLDISRRLASIWSYWFDLQVKILSCKPNLLNNLIQEGRGWSNWRKVA